MNIDKTPPPAPLCVEYVADLYVRPRQGGAPVSRGPVTVLREIPAMLAAA